MNNKITKLRKYLNLSRVKFSQAIGVSNTQMRRIEIVEIEANEELIRKICSTYHVNPAYFEGTVDLDDAVRVVDQEEKKKEVGKRVKQIRLENGMTLKELSALIDLSPSQLSLIENGEYKLTNRRAEAYKGDKLIQKRAPINLYTKKPDESINYDSYYIEDDHEPIVSKELWQKVQDRLDSYSKHRTQGSYFLKGKVYCGECGSQMKRISYTHHYIRQKVWKCEDRCKGKKGNGCKNEIISEEDLMILLSGTLGIPYNGLDNLNPEDYEDIGKITIYKNGEIQLEFE